MLPYDIQDSESLADGCRPLGFRVLHAGGWLPSAWFHSASRMVATRLVSLCLAHGCNPLASGIQSAWLMAAVRLDSDTLEGVVAIRLDSEGFADGCRPLGFIVPCAWLQSAWFHSV